MADVSGKIFNRNVILAPGATLWKNSASGFVQIMDENGNINAPLSTTNATFTGNTVLGDAAGDALTVNATATFNSTITVGVNGTGKDVKFFGDTTGKSWLWDESADKMIVTGTTTLDGETTLGSGSGIVSSVTNGIVPVNIVAAPQAISGAGAITITQYKTNVTSTGTDALTLADGAVKGQLKLIQMIVDGGDATLTPANLANGTTITFADAGDCALLQWNGVDWVAIDLFNRADGATAPVLA